MKNWILFIYFLISSFSFACGPWFPSNEETRYSLLMAEDGTKGLLSSFGFSAYVYDNQPVLTPSNDPNVEEWMKVMGANVDKESVFEMIYQLSRGEITKKNCSNLAVRFLKENKQDWLDYILFAKSCSKYNNRYSDPWEREQEDFDKIRLKKAQFAEKRAKKIKDTELKKRYAFIAIRLNYYSQSPKEVESLTNRFFTDDNQTFLGKWAHFFVLLDRNFESKAERNFELAHMFEVMPSKSLPLFVRFDTKIPAEEVLRYANNNRERANVLGMYQLRVVSKNLQGIQQIAQLDKNYPYIQFLIQREANKLEDWIGTPQFFAFPPSLNDEYWGYFENFDLYKKSIQKDKIYASQLLSWLEKNRSIFKDQVWFNSVCAVLSDLADDSETAKNYFKEVLSLEKNQFWATAMLSLLKCQELNKPELSDLNWSAIDQLPQKVRNDFLVRAARLFEQKECWGETIVLFSLAEDFENYENTPVWSSPKSSENLFGSFFCRAFRYMDLEFNSRMMEEAIDFIEQNQSEYPSQLEKLVAMKQELIDLHGAILVRENKLQDALVVFEKVDTSYWQKGVFKYYLGANPFHANFYSEHRETKGDTISYTKPKFIRQLLEYQKMADNPATENRSKYYFYVANAYYNMTTHGNSWLVKHDYWTSSQHVYSDDVDYTNCLLAIEYYLKAKEVASDDRVKMLCLRMAVKCEKQNLIYSKQFEDDSKYEDSYWDRLHNSNKYIQQLEKKYPNESEELLSNCHTFYRYYKILEKG